MRFPMYQLKVIPLNFKGEVNNLNTMCKKFFIYYGKYRIKSSQSKEGKGENLLLLSIYSLSSGLIHKATLRQELTPLYKDLK